VTSHSPEHDDAAIIAREDGGHGDGANAVLPGFVLPNSGPLIRGACPPQIVIAFRCWRLARLPSAPDDQHPVEGFAMPSDERSGPLRMVDGDRQRHETLRLDASGDVGRDVGGPRQPTETCLGGDLPHEDAHKGLVNGLAVRGMHGHGLHEADRNEFVLDQFDEVCRSEYDNSKAATCGGPANLRRLRLYSPIARG
jgi:hypothetical protein